MAEYRSDRAWSDRYLPTVKRIVGQRLLIATPDLIDRSCAADLMVVTARNMTIAARVRKPNKGYAERWGFDFTIRSRRDSGAETELSKILSGWADWLFYGHADDDTSDSVSRWMIVDLAAFRQVRGSDHPLRIRQLQNGDGTYFEAYDIRSFPARPRALLDASFHFRHLLEQAA